MRFYANSKHALHHTMKIWKFRSIYWFEFYSFPEIPSTCPWYHNSMNQRGMHVYCFAMQLKPAKNAQIIEYLNWEFTRSITPTFYNTSFFHILCISCDYVQWFFFRFVEFSQIFVPCTKNPPPQNTLNSAFQTHLYGCAYVLIRYVK